MLDKINDIKIALNNKGYLSALALSLTLPDICGQIEYPEFRLEYNKKKRDIRKQYITWFDEWVTHFYADNKGWTEDSKAINPMFTGIMCYELRCSFLHSGNSDIGIWGEPEDTDFRYSYQFELAVGGADMSGLSWVNQAVPNSKILKTKIVSVNIDKLCECICKSVEEYYRKRDANLFKDHKIKLIDFNRDFFIHEI